MLGVVNELVQNGIRCCFSVNSAKNCQYEALPKLKKNQTVGEAEEDTSPFAKALFIRIPKCQVIERVELVLAAKSFSTFQSKNIKGLIGIFN